MPEHGNSIPAHAIELAGADIGRHEGMGMAPGGAAAAPVLRAVDWAIEPGQFWVLCALAGSGKTDLLCTAAGLQRPLGGTHRLFGRDVAAMAEGELVRSRTRVAMVFADGHVFSSLTVAQNIALPVAYHQEISPAELEERVASLLALTGLEQWRDRRPAQVPRTWHQRIGLARALALRPDVLLVDNPLVGSDPRQGRWWLDFLVQLHARQSKTLEPITLVVGTDHLRPWLDPGTHFALLHDKSFTPIGGRDAVRNSTDPLLHEMIHPA